MRYTKNRKIAASAGLILCLAMNPLVVSAETEDVLQAGVTSVLDTRLTTEEYIALGQQAQGAAWGYTNIGIANVESGNLNVRETPSTGRRRIECEGTAGYGERHSDPGGLRGRDGLSGDSGRLDQGGCGFR